jgi:hypothetical protein
MKYLALGAHLASSFVYFDIAGTCHAALSHSASDDGRVTGHASAGSKDAGGDLHAMNIFGRSFGTDQDYRFAGIARTRLLDGIVGSEYDLADGGTGRSG